MQQAVVTARATDAPHGAAFAPSPVPVDIAMPSSLQHAFERLEGGFDPSDHLESSGRAKMERSTITELQIPSVWWCYCSWRIRWHRIGTVVS